MLKLALNDKGYRIIGKMCGIAGKYSLSRDARDRETIVNSMTTSLRKRGPDGEGIASSGPLTLGHRRLAIIDLSANASQPMTDEGKRFFIVYNGEVYNFKELRRELEDAGFTFFSSSDTEVVLKSYMHWGAECFKKFNGMFSLAIWDGKKNELILARDRFGKKPLYYHISNDFSLSFASTLSALIKDPDVPSDVSMEAVNCFLALGYILSPLSFVEGVRKLEPAHYLRFDFKSKTMTKTRYWDYAGCFREKIKKKEPEICKDIFSLFRQAVKRRMVSDVPLGAFLSGGIDSTSVVKMMLEFNPDVMAFSIGFISEPDYDELADAKQAAAAISVKRHFYKSLDTGSVPDEMHSMFEAFDEPFADTSLVPMMHLSEFSRSRITVALSGDGADEIFGGYVTYLADSLAGKYRNVPSSLRNRIASLANAFPPVSLNRKVGFDYKLRQFLTGARFDEEKSHYSWRLMFTPEERVSLLGSGHKELIYDTDPFYLFKGHYDEAGGLEPLDRHLYVDAKSWLSDDILVKLDRSTMHVGLEARCPFLDNDLVEYMAAVPSKMKLKYFTLKRLLKKTMTGVLPDSIIKKKKSGFNAPVERWIRQVSGSKKNDCISKNEYSYFVWHVYENFMRRRQAYEKN